MQNPESQSDKYPYTVELGQRGRLVLPAAIRNLLGLNEGDKFVLTLGKDGSIHLASMHSKIVKLRGMLKPLVKNRRLSEELIAERRAEAKRG